MRGAYAARRMAKTLTRSAAPSSKPGAPIQMSNSFAQEEARRFILEVAQSANVTMTEVARRASVNQTTVTRSMASRSPHPISARTVAAIADAMGRAPPPWLLEALPQGRERTHKAGPAQAAARAPAPVHASGLIRDVPLYGALIVGRGPLFRLNPHAVDHALRPPGIIAARKVFALRMPDDSMAPWRRAGELIFIDPARPVRRGDHAMFHLADPSLPDEDPICLIRLVNAGATADAITQAVAHAATGPEPFLKGLQVIDRTRVLEWEELLNG
jgi:SOS-response transcriptional repressor LexA